MPIIPAGSVNLAALNVPNVIVQIVPPNPLLNGIPTDIVGIVGIASWGPTNSPVVIGGMTQQVQNFGNPIASKYDLGTAVYINTLAGLGNFRCVRVTDGTDTSAQVAVLDTISGIGAYLTGIYTGEVGNTVSAVIGIGSSYTPLVPTYKITIYMAGGIPETYDNIGGSGNAFWLNLVNAINLGQSVARGPSQLVIASLPTGIESVTITASGIYQSVPTLSTTGPGTGATFRAHLSALNAVLVGAGSNYAVNDTIILGGGTFASAAKIIVDTVDGLGAILTYHIDPANEGDYTTIPVDPVAQGSTSGIGIGATFNMDWTLLEIEVLTTGSGYTLASALVISGSGGGAATLNIGSVASPAQITYTLSGGTNGNATITSATLLGSDTANPRTGMYALRNQVGGGMVMLADADDSTKWPAQRDFSQSESCYVIGTGPAGYQDNISGMSTLLQNSGINFYGFSVLQGDWCQFNDPFNNVTRYISPQSFKCEELASQLPSSSALNKPANGIVGTQKTNEGRVYSDAELSQLRTGRIEVITRPLPVSQSQFGCRLGINTSSNPLEQTDNYPRMVNFLGLTILNAMGQFIGQPQTPTVRLQCSALIETFLSNLFTLGMIGDVNQPGDPNAAYKVILDDSNNPNSRVALGFMQADVQVNIFSIIQYLVVNLSVQQGGLVTVSAPVPAV